MGSGVTCGVLLAYHLPDFALLSHWSEPLMTSSSYRRGARPRPMVKTRVTIRSLPEVFQVALRWTAAWAVVGLVLGILLMLGKAPPFAESGAKPDSIFGY